MRIIANQLLNRGDVRVKKVRLDIGALAPVEPQALQLGFKVVSRGTSAEGSTLEIITLPGRGWCGLCDAEQAVFRHGCECSQCGTLLLPRGGGDALRVKDLELE